MLSNYEKKIVTGLTDKQDAFVKEYVQNNNAKQSAINAGYSERTAKEQGYQLLQNPLVKNAIDQAKHERDMFMQEQFKAGAIEAYNALMGIIRDPEANQQHRVSASKDILDRAGFKATIKTENTLEVNYNDTANTLDSKLENAFNALNDQRTKEPDIIESD